MLIKFWLGIVLSIVIGILLMLILGWITKKRNKGGGLGALLGFFLGFGVFLFFLLGPRRAYVITGDEEYIHYLVLGSPEYGMPSGEKKALDMAYDECYVINEWEEPVVIEEAVYGGYGFSGSTDWVHPLEYEIMPNHKIDYFYDNEPPDEISVKDDSEETVRLWLRKKRD